MKKSLIYIKTLQYPNVDWSSMCACMCMGGTNSDASSFHRNFLRFTHLFQTIPQNGATLIKTSYYALQPREQLRRASWYRNQSARGTSHSLQHPICRVHWNRQNHFDSRFRRPAEPRGAGKSTYGPAGLSTLSPLRGNKPHTTEGPHRGQARGAADAADRARPPPGAATPTERRQAQRRQALPVLRCRGTARRPRLPRHHVPENAAIFAPPPSTAGRKRRPRPRLYGAGWEAGGAALRVPRPGWAASGGGRRRGHAANAPRAESERETLFFWWRISSVRPGHLLTILPLLWKPGVVFSPCKSKPEYGRGAGPRSCGCMQAARSREQIVSLTPGATSLLNARCVFAMGTCFAFAYSAVIFSSV